MDSSAFFDSQLKSLLKRLDKRIDAYFRDPEDSKSIHDVRTSLRRLNSVYSILGRKTRKANKKKMSKYRAFFKASNKVRDYDIIAAKLDELSADSRPLADKLTRLRAAEAGRVIKKGKFLKKIGRIKLQGVDPEEFEKRIDKVMKKLSDRIRTNLALTLSDSTKIDELHALRKDLKKLRYILESVDKRIVKKYQRMVGGATGLSVDEHHLEKLQSMLGQLHDTDITLDYLSSSKSEVAKDLISKESRVRDSLYRQFADYVRSVLPADTEPMQEGSMKPSLETENRSV